MALLRPSELARVWELNPKTVTLWIREGRLPAIKTPGSQYRVRTDDARAYCEKNGLPMPREARGPVVALVGKPGASQRVLTRACKAAGAAVSAWASAIEALVAIAADVPDVLAIDARCADVRVPVVVRALRKNARTAAIPVVVYDAPPRASRAGALAKLDVSLAARGKTEDAARAISDLLAAIVSRGRA
jgi:excisionase family DNA binding protein